MTAEERYFWSRVEKTDACWLWTGPRNHHGYGLAYNRANQLNIFAHRLSWRLHHGALPADKDVCHHCDTPRCVRPDHLFLGTHLDNMADMKQKGRARNLDMTKTHCPHDHPYAGENLIHYQTSRGWRRWCRICISEAKRRFAESHREQERIRSRMRRAALRQAPGEAP